jgi:transcriptional regulator with XRE-family HTH domain
MAKTREILAKNLKENRQKCGLTQAELAEKAGISTNFVAMIELKHKFPAPETLDRLATALNVQVPELFVVQASQEDTIEKFYHAILGDLDQSIERAIDKAIDKRCKNDQITLEEKR